MTKQNVLSSNMAATPLSFGSPGIGCKPIIGSSCKNVVLRVKFCVERCSRKGLQKVICRNVWKFHLNSRLLQGKKLAEVLLDNAVDKKG